MTVANALTALAILILQTGGGTTSSGQEALLARARATEALALFKKIASEKNPVALNLQAVQVCRAVFIASLRGDHSASDLVTSYSGPMRPLLAFECEGYMAAAHDFLQADYGMSEKAR